MYLLLIILISVIIFLFLTNFFLKKNKSNRRNYALGLQAAEDVEIFIKQRNFSAAEKFANNQDINDITQIIDHLALSLQEEELVSWETTTNSDFSRLTLGVYYLHLAWIIRSHRLAKEVSEAEIEKFFEYLQLCEFNFDSLSENSFYKPELLSRKIRLYMSLNKKDLAIQAFYNITKKYPNFIWPYIHFAELIQPKWGGEIPELIKFYKELPDNYLIKSIVTLKLAYDSLVMEENYFDLYNSDIVQFTRERIKEINALHNKNNLSSIHRYVLYNYLEILSDIYGLNELKKKYKKLSKNYNTIYPRGLLS